jgi:hypothetical protein
MAKNMLTETDALAKCLARALANEPKSFGSEQAKLATGVATTLLAAGSLDTETFGRVIARLGNHSALRQWAVQHGFIGKEADALAIKVSEEIAAEKERLAEMTK